MATVENRAQIGTPVDQRLRTPNRIVADVPISVVTPQYAGELVAQAGNGNLWYANDLTSASWVPVSVEA
jgi:hypothetical protein